VHTSRSPRRRQPQRVERATPRHPRASDARCAPPRARARPRHRSQPHRRDCSVKEEAMTKKAIAKKQIEHLSIDELSKAVRDIHDAIDDIDGGSESWSNWQRRQLQNVFRRAGIAA